MPQLNIARRLDLRTEVLNKTILTLAIPTILENLLVTAVFFIDTFIVGWLQDENSLAATLLAGTVMWVMASPFQSLSWAAASLVARAWGENNFYLARKYAGQSISLALLFSIIILIFGWLMAEQMMSWLGASPAVISLGAEYLKIVLLSIILGIPMLIGNGIIRGTGDTKTPLFITLIMNIINVLISIILAFGLGPIPAMGLAGVAWGTMIAQSTGGLMTLIVLTQKMTMIHLPIRYFIYWNPLLLKKVWHLSYPLILERALNSFAHVIFLRIVAILGTTALAAHNIALRVESLAFMPALGISVAMTTIVGQSIGAKNPDIGETAVRRTLYYFGLIMIGLGLIFVLFARQMVVIFGATPEVIRLAGIVLQISAIELPLMAFTMILSGALRGAGDTRSPLYVMLVCILLFRFGIVYLFAIILGWGLPGVWLATSIDWAGRSIGLWYIFKKGYWKTIHK